MENQDFVKVPPHSLEAEQSVIGAMILDKENISQVAQELSAKDFFDKAHIIIFECIMDLYNLDKHIDLVTVSDKLNTLDQLDAVGGVSYLTQIAMNIPTTANLSYYIQIIKDKSMLRQLIGAANDIIKISYQDYDDTAQIVDKSTKYLYDVIEGQTSSHFSPISDVIVDTLEEVANRGKNKGKVTGIPTGFGDLDSLTSGWQKSDLILIAARPAMGKTSFALNLAENAALKYNKTVAIFSLEMSKEQLVTRILSSAASVDSEKLRKGTVDASDWDKIASATVPLSQAPIYIDDTANISISEIRAKCRRLKYEKDLGLVIIDYLQLMELHGKSESRQNEIAKISRSLKILAKELDVPVIALSQLSRGPEQRADNHRPMLSDLRESGAIEQDADIVVFLYRDEVYNPETEAKGIAECIIAKHRGGSLATVKLGWQPQFTRFVGLSNVK